MNKKSIENLKKCYEQYKRVILDEAKFTKNTGWSHYTKHVTDIDAAGNYLRGGKQTTEAGPYYEYMSFQEYCDRAEELTLTPAGKWDSKEEVVGCTLWNSRDGFRLLKMRNSLEDIKDEDESMFQDVVIYVDPSIVKVGSPNKGEEIISYMPVQTKKAFSRYDKQKVCELPENIPDTPPGEDDLDESFLNLFT